MTTTHDDAAELPCPPAQMTREEWLRYHVARAPKISPEQWRRTTVILSEYDVTDRP